ncbi:hypothetical protein ABW19_dt0210366 [Dactylella cylindrospora]|nr:hypothetical protein ABW19_dt0210366 [Dactylella cylindrospora]
MESVEPEPAAEKRRKRKRAPPNTSLEDHKDEIKFYYLGLGYTKEKVREIIESKYQLGASATQYRDRLSKWGFRKQGTEEQWKVIAKAYISRGDTKPADAVINQNLGHVANSKYFKVLRLLLYRLSNRILDFEDINELLDQVVSEGYYSSLTSLLCLNTISAIAACNNALPILALRRDLDLILAIYSKHTWIATSWIGILVKIEKLWRGEVCPDIFSKCEEWLLLELRRTKQVPMSEVEAVNLLRCCFKHQRLGLFIELWNPKLYAGAIESLHFQNTGRYVLDTEDVGILEKFISLGFRMGVSVLILQSLIAKKHHITAVLLNYASGRLQIADSTDPQIISPALGDPVAPNYTLLTRFFDAYLAEPDLPKLLAAALFVGNEDLGNLILQYVNENSSTHNSKDLEKKLIAVCFSENWEGGWFDLQAKCITNTGIPSAPSRARMELLRVTPPRSMVVPGSKRLQMVSNFLLLNKIGRARLITSAELDEFRCSPDVAVNLMSTDRILEIDGKNYEIYRLERKKPGRSSISITVSIQILVVGDIPTLPSKSRTVDLRQHLELPGTLQDIMSSTNGIFDETIGGGSPCKFPQQKPMPPKLEEQDDPQPSALTSITSDAPKLPVYACPVCAEEKLHSKERVDSMLSVGAWSLVEKTCLGPTEHVAEQIFDVFELFSYKLQKPELCNDVLFWIRGLLEMGLEVDYRSTKGTPSNSYRRGRTILQVAADWFNDTNLVAMLIEFGADVDAPGVGILGTALQGCCRKPSAVVKPQTSRVECVRLLVQAGADLNAESPDGERPVFTPLDGAVLSGDLSTARYLLEKGARLDARTVGYAVRTARLDMVSLFVQYNMRFYDYALGVSRDCGERVIEEYLLDLQRGQAPIGIPSEYTFNQDFLRIQEVDVE